jgi:RNA methyltransferase, TrmH family
LQKVSSGYTQMISKAQASFIKSLHQKKYRYENQLFIAEGYKIVEELITAGYSIKTICIIDHQWNDFVAKHSKISKNTEILSLTSGELERISALSTASEILAVVHIPASHINVFIPDYYHDHLALCLDEVKDPGNLGTIIRIADWFGLKRIICSIGTVELYNPKVIQSTMGSFTRVEVIYSNLHDFLEGMKNVKIYGALLDGRNIYQEQLSKKGLILMGSESHGISRELIKFITDPLTIPSFGGAESLNVAVATGIICSEFSRN